MANRYYTFAELSQMETNKEHRAPGTLGRHYFKITKKEETRIMVAGWNSDGTKAGETTIKRDGSLGYNCGSVWAIKPKSDMTPIELLRSEFRISKEMVFIIPLSEVENIQLQELISAVEGSQHANHSLFWGNGETWGYKGNYCAFTIYHSFHGGTDQRRRINRVFLVKEYYDDAVKECHNALSEYNKPGSNYIRHNRKCAQTGLLFAP